MYNCCIQRYIIIFINIDAWQTKTVTPNRYQSIDMKRTKSERSENSLFTSIATKPKRVAYVTANYIAHLTGQAFITELVVTLLTPLLQTKNTMLLECYAIHIIYLFRSSQLSTLYSTVRSRTEMTMITTVRYQGNALTDNFNANRLQCLALLVHTSTNS